MPVLENARSSRLPTLADVAARAGVSTATADRALNNRPGVRPATLRRVLQAASELDYITDPQQQVLAGLRPLRLSFLLPAGERSFVTMLGRLIAGAQPQFAAENMSARVESFQSFRPEHLVQKLKEAGREVDGIAFMALEHPLVREAVNTLAERGIPTVTLITDVGNSERVAYVGLENRSAGRTAGYLIGRFMASRSAKVAMIAGSLSYRAHEEREMGFMHLFREQFPGIEVLGLREGFDEDARNYRQTKALLAMHPDLAGIYNIGGAALGVARALKEAGRQHDVVFVGHGLTRETRSLLLDGTMDAVITQSPQATLASTVSIFANLRAGRLPTEAVSLPSIEVIFRENLP